MASSSRRKSTVAGCSRVRSREVTEPPRSTRRGAQRVIPTPAPISRTRRWVRRCPVNVPYGPSAKTRVPGFRRLSARLWPPRYLTVKRNIRDRRVPRASTGSTPTTGPCSGKRQRKNWPGWAANPQVLAGLPRRHGPGDSATTDAIGAGGGSSPRAGPRSGTRPAAEDRDVQRRQKDASGLVGS